MSEEEKFDGVMYQMVSASGGYEGFFDHVFSFLRRKTDFFIDPKRAEQVIANSGKKHIDAHQKDAKEKQAKKDQEKELREQKLKQQAAEKAQAEKNKAEAPKPAEDKKPADDSTKPADSEPKTEEGEKKSDKLKPGPGNGSSTDSYSWTQTLEEVQAVIPIEKGVKAKDLTIKMEVERCVIAKKDGSKVYVDGAWFGKVHPDDSLWTIEETSGGERSVQLTLMKWRNTQQWWDCLIKGEAPIDTQKINPEPSKLSDLDGDMKSTVGKMMFDMNQKQKGLPSSEELEKQEKLQAFMKAHPEMDFSKAKFG